MRRRSAGPLPAVFIRAPRIRQRRAGRRGPRRARRRAGPRAAGQRRGRDVSPGADRRPPAAPPALRAGSSRQGGAREPRLDRDARRDRGPDAQSAEGQRLLARARRGALAGARRAGEGARRRARLGPARACSRPAGTCRCSSTATAPGWRSSSGDYCDLVRQLFVFGPPLVAALSGHAIAGGLIAAMGADERIAAEGKGKFGLSEVILGVSVPACLMEPFRHVRRRAPDGAPGGDGGEPRGRARARDRPRGRRSSRPGSCSTARSSGRAFSPAFRAPPTRPSSCARARPRSRGSTRRATTIPSSTSGSARTRGSGSNDMVARLCRARRDSGRRDPRGARPLAGRARASAFSRRCLRASTPGCPSRTPRRSCATRESRIPAEKPRTPGVFWQEHLESGPAAPALRASRRSSALLDALGFRSRARLLGRVQQRLRPRGPPGRDARRGSRSRTSAFRCRRSCPRGRAASRRRQGELEIARDGARASRIAFRRGRAGRAARDRGLLGAPVSDEAFDGALARDLPAGRALPARGRRCGATSATASSPSRAGRCASTTCTRACACRSPAPRERRARGALRHRCGGARAAFAIAGDRATPAAPSAPDGVPRDRRGARRGASARSRRADGYRRLLEGVADVVVGRGRSGRVPADALGAASGARSPAAAIVGRRRARCRPARRVASRAAARTGDTRLAFRVRGARGEKTYLMREAALRGRARGPSAQRLAARPPGGLARGGPARLGEDALSLRRSRTGRISPTRAAAGAARASAATSRRMRDSDGGFMWYR